MNVMLGDVGCSLLHGASALLYVTPLCVPLLIPGNPIVSAVPFEPPEPDVEM